MERSRKNRTQSFRWNNRHHLYEYFKEKYGIEKKEVDVEIQRVMALFRPRKGALIRTQELWQKVGNDLEAEITGVRQSFEADNDEAVFEVTISEKLPEQLTGTPESAAKTEKTIDLIITEKLTELPPQPVIAPDLLPPPLLAESTELSILKDDVADPDALDPGIDEVMYLEDLGTKDS